jgi:ribosomal protein S18 acetylase RimI-like enzyme
MMIENVTIERRGELLEEAATLLAQTSWGTHEALYKVLNYPESIATVNHKNFFYGWQEGRLVAMRMATQKTVHCGARPVQAFYHTLFCVKPELQGHGLGRLLADEMLRSLSKDIPFDGFVYSFTERGNERSAAIKEKQGYQWMGQFHVTGFSRFFPKRSARMQRLQASDKEAVRGALENYYRGHGMTDFDYSLSIPHYYVLKEGNQILAGVQAEFQHWQIQSLAGISGQIALSLLPKLPLVRDIFNPADFRLLRFGNLFAAPGQEKAAHELMESVLADHNLKTAVLFLDKRSPHYDRLLSAGPFGPLRYLTETAMDVVGYPVNMPSSDWEALKKMPLNISPADI